MVKKKRSWAEDLIVSGVGLSLGAGIVEKLPSSAAKTGVSKGLGTAGSFYPTMATVGITGGIVRQLKGIRRK